MTWPKIKVSPTSTICMTPTLNIKLNETAHPEIKNQDTGSVQLELKASLKQNLSALPSDTQTEASLRSLKQILSFKENPKKRKLR